MSGFDNRIIDAHIQKYNDSIIKLVEASKNQKLSILKRKEFLRKAYNRSNKITNDSLLNAYLLKISFAYYKLGDSFSFRKFNFKSTALSKKINDSVGLAANYWDLGNLFSKYGVKDSAYFSYFKAQKIYQLSGNNFFSGRMLLNMAIMQSDVKDYTGSEITTIKAIELFKPLKKYNKLYRCYNNLGINFNELGNYNKALEYHNEALEYQKKIRNKNSFYENTLNNIGVVYKNKNEHKIAIKNYLLALENKNLKNTNIRLYAKLLDNLAFSKLKLNDLKNTEELFYKSLKIRDSLNDYLGIAINKLHLAEFYTLKKDTTNAKQLAIEARELSKNTNNFRDLLAALLLLSKLDKHNGLGYMDRYVKLNDSLLKQERSIRNKFTRIKFETNEFIDENERLSKENRVIITLAILSALIGFLLIFVLFLRAKNKELKFKQQQQQSNEEIYKLMITQQNKLDEGSRKEKKRISQELHDGVLGKLFGARLILGTLNTKIDTESVSKRQGYINELQDIEEEIRNISHQLHDASPEINIGYPKMVEDLLEKQSEITRFYYEFDYDKNIKWEVLDGGLKMNLYRILQEAIQNINKYASAKNVIVQFKNKKGILALNIIDDGKGFNIYSKRKGIGLTNIKNRIENLNGNLSIQSKLNEGTALNIEVPI